MGSVTPDFKALLLSLKPDDITFEFVKKWFARKYNIQTKKMEDPKVLWTDKMSLKANEYFNTTNIETTAGKFIYNKFIVEPHFIKILGYINQPVSKSKLGDIENTLSKALLDDKITPEQMGDYFNRSQWFALTLHSISCGSFTPKTIEPLPEIVKKRNKLFEENKEALEKGDVIVAAKIENELMADTRRLLKDDVGVDLYNSGSRGSFENNYKNMLIMRGAVYNPLDEKFDILKTGFVEGLEKKDIPSYGTQVVSGAYPKAVGTKVAGYATKKYFTVYQDIVLGPRNSDCGTKMLEEIYLTPKNYKSFMYRYILDGSKLVPLVEDNYKKFLNKKVKMRSPLYCISDKLCNKCAGDIFYKLGVTNAGLTTSSIGSHFLNLLMKSFHDATVKVSSIDINDIML